MFEILPLEWQDLDGFSIAFVGFGHYQVHSTRGWHLIRPRGCYGKAEVKCNSLDDGKRRAERHYRKLMEFNLRTIDRGPTE